MAYATGYKRPRPDEFEPAPYMDYGQYAPPPDYGHLGVPPVAPPPMLQPLQAQLPAQAPPPEPLRLGSAPDGTMPVVKLRGLPFSCDIESINMFLEVETVDVVLVRRQGRFSGEAFVVLPGMMQVEFALNKHKAYMGKRYVEVQQCGREDYYRAVASYVEDWGLNDGPPSSRGQPYNRLPDHADVRQPYGGGPPSARGMPDRSPGRRPPPRTSDRKFDDKDRPGPGPLPSTGVLRLRGLPFGVSSEEVAAWFNDAGILQQPITVNDVHPVLAYDGRPTGSAFVEFASPTDSENAMAKDKANMGSRYVELFHSCKDEMLIATAGR